jgi:hypothetical protein
MRAIHPLRQSPRGSPAMAGSYSDLCRASLAVQWRQHRRSPRRFLDGLGGHLHRIEVQATWIESLSEARGAVARQLSDQTSRTLR